MNIILIIIAVALAAAGAMLFFRTVGQMRRWDDDTLKSQKCLNLIALVIALAMLIGGCFIFKDRVVSPSTQETTTEVSEKVDSGENDTEDNANGDEAAGSTEIAETNESEADSETPSEQPVGGTKLNVFLAVLGVIFLLIALRITYMAITNRVHRRKRIVAALVAVALALILLITNGGQAYATLMNNAVETEADSDRGLFGGLFDTETETESEAESESKAEQDILPEGAFAIDFSEDDLLKAMRQRFGEDFTWEKYQNDFSDDLFPSRYQERKKRVQEAMGKWYEDPDREGFNDPVWFPMDDLINVYHTDDWKNMTKEQKKEILDKELLKSYDQILRNPRFCEMFVEFFYKLAEGIPEIITRNESWLPAFNEWYSRANDSANIVQNVDGKDVVAGVSVFFEPISNADDAKVLQKEYVKNAARICLMMDEFSYALKEPVKSPTSEVNWHLAFGKDAATAKVSMLVAPEDQEKEPAVMLLYKYKSGTVIKAGINIFDCRLEIFPLDKEKDPTPSRSKEAPPSKKTTPPTEKTPPNNPAPNKEPDPGKNPTPSKTKEAPLVVHFQEQGTKEVLRSDHRQNYSVGTEYSYTAPKSISKNGKEYKIVGDRNVSGKMPEKGVEQTIYYKAENNPPPKSVDYNFTVQYKYRDGGGNVFDPDSSRHKAGDIFTVSAKPKDGYSVEGASSHEVTMPSHDGSYTFWYVKDKKPNRRPNENDGPTDPQDDEQQTEKPDKKPNKPVPSQPDKKPDGLPDQKPDAPAGNGNSDNSGNKVPPPINPDINATVDGPNGSTTTNTGNDEPGHRVPAPVD